MADATEPVREVEAKWVVPDPSRARAFLAALGVGPRAAGRRTAVHDVYYDTADRSVLGAGYGYRLRRVGAGAHEATLKSFGVPSRSGVVDREERTARIAHASPEPRLLPDGALRSLLSAIVRDRPLAPLARVVGSRTTWRLRPAPGMTVAASLDDVRTSAGGVARRSTEVEAELVLGDPATFRAWIATVPRAGVRPSRASKLERALAAGGIRRPSPSAIALARLRARPAVSGSDPAAEAAAQALARGAEDLARAMAAARSGSADGVHDVRTTSRRLRAVLGAFRDEVGGAARADLRRALRALRRAAGPVRDLDVLRDALAEVPADRARRAGLARLRRAIRGRRRALRTRLATVLASARARALPARLAAAAAAGLARPSPPFAVAGAGRLPRALEEALARAAALPPVPATARPADLHALRIALKRARYAAEVFAPAFGKPVARFARGAQRAQDVLGLVQDARAQRAVLASLLSARGPARRGPTRSEQAAAAAVVAAVDRRAKGALSMLEDTLFGVLSARRLRALGEHLMKRAAGTPPRRRVLEY